MACDYSVSIDYSTELMNCEELHAILHLVLQAGNIMNAVSLFLFLYFQCSLPFTPHLPPFLWTFPSILFSLLFFPFNYSSKTFPDVFKSGRVNGFYSIDQTLTDVLCVFIGWLCRQCCGLQTAFTTFSCWHKGQQAWHEPAPFCGTSKWDRTRCTIVFSRFNDPFL